MVFIFLCEGRDVNYFGSFMWYRPETVFLGSIEVVKAVVVRDLAERLCSPSGRGSCSSIYLLQFDVVLPLALTAPTASMASKITISNYKPRSILSHSFC